MNVIHKKRIRLFSVFLAAAALHMAFLLYTGVILFNNPSREIYPVRGVDVSHHQGKIDWDTLARQDIQFAYIKATEGSNFKDKIFRKTFSALPGQAFASARTTFSVMTAAASHNI